MKNLIVWIRSLNRNAKRFILTCVDVFSIAIALAVMHEIFGLHWQFDVASQLFVVLAVNALITVICLAIFGIYNISIRFLSKRIWSIAAVSTTISSCSLFAISHFLQVKYTLLTVGAYWIVLFVNLIFSRLLASGILNYDKHYMATGAPCAIYGAGDAGVQLSEILQRGQVHSPLVFIDDNSNMHGMYVKGLPVINFNDFKRTYTVLEIKTVFIATPNASQRQIQAIFKRLADAAVKVFTADNLSKFTNKNQQRPQYRRLEIEDLLGRSTIAPVPKLMAANIRGKEVLITGAGGSIGSELCRQALSQSPTKILLFESSEFALYKIKQELLDLKNQKHQNVEVLPILGSVQDHQIINEVLEAFNVFSIYHAAAYKHVPIVEMNIVEAVKNNVLGTLTLARAASKYNVSNFTLISTDKAVRPANFMGATKRIAEMICQALEQVSPNTKFSIVRFGNVFGSSGSVVPAFHRQILAGGPITVTHPKVVRFFMSISEAAQLVIQSSALAKGGEVFTLDMGEPVKILDVAKLMARLYNLTPVMSPQWITDGETSGDTIDIQITGLRPGEKLYEELSINGKLEKTIHPKINATLENFLPFSELEPYLHQLQAGISARDLEVIEKILNEAPICFKRNGSIVDIFSGTTKA